MRPLSLAGLLALLLAPAAVSTASPPDPVHASARVAVPGAHDPGAPPPVDEAREELEADERPASGDAAAPGEDGELEASGEWSVDHPPAGFDDLFEIPLDVREGTWMSLDVSPDGEHVVFDLLGDLYAVPIEGGEARPLTSGLAWDMQPAFSPDGRFLAFTSDRGGGDNLWLLPWSADGAEAGEPVQVTKEDFRLVNSPAWSPDGRFLAARKHFTAERSLGAGEIWLYHVTGGGGLQMTEKPNDQKDVGEPVFSPDGRYLYFSQDTTPGPIFEYNKDPHGEIYTVRRLDRETGEIEPFLTGPGGAVRPTPSPDGSRLAFVRRLDTKTALWLHDLESGESRPIYDGLDRDMQETWAIHGVYPRMAWTPDAREIVFWAGGGIHRIDVDTREVTPVPFHVEDTRQAAPAVRFPVEVHPDRFETKMLRWVEVSPAGDRVVYEALGKVWVRDLPRGEPRRLTGQEEHHELYPTFSRDGRQVAWVTWDDEELGSVRVAGVASGPVEGRVVSDRPGHYVEPAFSPDGRHLVYRRIEGGYLTSPTWSRDPGIYRVPNDSLAVPGPVRIARSGVDPHFGASSDRVYLLTFEEEGRRALASVRLAGPEDQEPRKHLVSDAATEFRVSPDGKLVAFRERFDAHVAPFAATGKTQEIGPEATAVPVREVSRQAGEYLHWSGDSTTLHWALGPELYSLDLPASLDFLQGPEAGSGEEGANRAGAEDADELPVEVVPLGFEVASDRPEGTLALVGGRVITMRSEEVIEDGTVLIEGHRIAAVGARSEVEVPAGAHVVDVTGKTLLPGFVDVHWHGAQGMSEIVPEQNWNNLATLAFGVTTLHDPSNDTSEIFAASELARAGEVLAPRIFSTGTILYGAKAPIKAIVDSLDDALFHLERLEAVGAWSVKSYNQPRRDQRQQVLAAARELGMMVLPEGGSLFQHNMNMIVDGHTGIEHSIPVAAIYDDVVQLWSATEVGYTPTLVVGYGGLWGENYWYAKTDVWADPLLTAFVPREVVVPRSRRRLLAADDDWNHFANARVAAELDDAGVLVQLGAHGQREGLAAHWELWMFEQGGMTPMEALAAATINGARYLGLDGDLGSLEPGKLADVVVLEENPLEDLRASRSVERVVLNGRLYDAATLDQLWPEAVERPPLYWERKPGVFGELARPGAP